MRVGYLGPEGTFSEEAAARVDGERVGFESVHAVVAALSAGEIERGVVPIENSLEGAVNTTLDALVHDFTDVAIVGEVVLPIHQALIALQPLPLSAITRVRSHPQALAQCAGFLRRELPGARPVATGSTSGAIAELSGDEAAIAPARAAALHGAVVLREGIEDDASNATRFVVLGPAGTTVADPERTTIVFAGSGDDSPGWLVRCLSEFAFRGVNLTKIESRPARRRLGHYFFLVDCDGGRDEPAVAEAIDGLRNHCEEVRILGSYGVGQGLPLH